MVSPTLTAWRVAVLLSSQGMPRLATSFATLPCAAADEVATAAAASPAPASPRASRRDQRASRRSLGVAISVLLQRFPMRQTSAAVIPKASAAASRTNPTRPHLCDCPTRTRLDAGCSRTAGHKEATTRSDRGPTAHATVHHAHRDRGAAADGQRRYRQDHPGAPAEDHQAHRARRRAVRDPALPRRRPRARGLHPQPPPVPATPRS